MDRSKVDRTGLNWNIYANKKEMSLLAKAVGRFRNGRFFLVGWGGSTTTTATARSQAASITDQLDFWAPMLAVLRGGGGSGGGRSSSNEAADREGQEPKREEAEAVAPAAAGASPEPETQGERASLLPVKGQLETSESAEEEGEVEEGGGGEVEDEGEGEGGGGEEAEVEEKAGEEEEGEEEKELARFWPSKVLAQLIEKLNESLLEAKKSRARIKKLKEWKMHGITTLAGGERFEAEKKKRQEKGGLPSEGGDGGKGVRGEKLVDITGAPGSKYLTPAERRLCSQLHMIPGPYLTIKHAMIQECVSSGCLKKENISSLATTEAGPLSKMRTRKYTIHSTHGSVDSLRL